ARPDRRGRRSRDLRPARADQGARLRCRPGLLLRSPSPGERDRRAARRRIDSTAAPQAGRHLRARAPYEIIAGMSEGNVELVRALIDRWNERGEAALDAYHDDVEWDFSGWDFEVEGTWRGMEGIESVLEGLRERWEEVR